MVPTNAPTQIGIQALALLDEMGASAVARNGRSREVVHGEPVASVHLDYIGQDFVQIRRQRGFRASRLTTGRCTTALGQLRHMDA